MRSPALRLVTGLGGVVVAAALSCGPSDPVCVAGRSVACPCPGGGEGVQTCNDDGSGYDACGFCSAPRPGFTDATHALGLPDYAGPCIGFEDFDGNGTLDLVLSVLDSGAQPGGPSSSKLSIYPGDGHGHFGAPVLITESFLTLCATGDMDRDGRVDLVTVMMGTGGKTQLQLWYNRGGLTFQRDPGAFDFPLLADAQIYALGLWDYDEDGWLDVLVGRNAGSPLAQLKDCGFDAPDDFACRVPTSTDNAPPEVFHNEHGALRLTPGVIPAPYAGTTNAVAFTDYDRDGLVDVFLSEDFYTNHLLRQVAPGQYEHAEHKCGVEHYNHGMGAAFADYDGDGRWDVYSVDIGPSKLWFGQPNDVMKNRALELGIADATHYHSNWAPIGEDFDLDGRPDVFVATAGVVDNDLDLAHLALSQELANPHDPQYDLVFWNEPWGGFTPRKIPHRPGQTPSVVFAATAMGDYDGDGDLDVLVATDMPMQLRFLRNDQPRGNYLVVRLVGTASNRDGIGAEVSVRAGGRTQMRTVGDQGTLGASWRRAHFGLGSATRVDELRVRWPTGKTQVVGSVAANRTVTVTEP